LQPATRLKQVTIDKKTIQAIEEWLKKGKHADNKDGFQTFDAGNLLPPDRRPVYPQQWMERDSTVPAWVEKAAEKQKLVQQLRAERYGTVKPPSGPSSLQ
jgi:hypothetical protein